jgi:hypothetical protein
MGMLMPSTRTAVRFEASSVRQGDVEREFHLVASRQNHVISQQAAFDEYSGGRRAG